MVGQMLNRRGFFLGLGAGLVAAPAVLRFPLEMTPRGVIIKPTPQLLWAMPAQGGYRYSEAQWEVLMQPGWTLDVADLFGRSA